MHYSFFDNPTNHSTTERGKERQFRFFI